MIKTYDVLLILSAVAGMVMVLGGIFLLYKGAIKLAAPAPGSDKPARLSGVLLVEFGKLRITTQSAALGIFVIGLLFVVIPLWLAPKPPPLRPFTLVGDVRASDEVHVFVRRRWVTLADENGSLLLSIYPDLEHLEVQFKAPGHRVETVRLAMDTLRGTTIDLGEVVLVQELERPETADTVPLGFQPPPLSRPSFGESDVGGGRQ